MPPLHRIADPCDEDATIEHAVEPTVANIGNQMLGIQQGGYALPFEVVSILLLAALIGCIVIAMRSKPQTT